MSAHMIARDYDDSQLSADRRRARVRLCASTPRDTRSAGIGAFDEGAQRRVDGYLAWLVVAGLPLIVWQLIERV